MSALATVAEYALATGTNAVGRLDLLHSIYSPVGCQILEQAGLTSGMHVVDFGCGTGTMARAIASMVGSDGTVTGVDMNRPQLDQAWTLCRQEGYTNTCFVEADACYTTLSRGAYDAVYCRFLLLHLPDPAACLREMWAVLKPGGILVVEDGDLAAATSVPRTALQAFADLFSQLGSVRGLNYSIANNLADMVAETGFVDLGVEVHQPAARAGAPGLLLKWSVAEAGPAFVKEGLITETQLTQTLDDMEKAANDPDVLAIGPRMTLVWGRKPKA